MRGWVWVVGADGFVGRHVAREFADQGWAVAGLSRRPWGHSSAWGLRHHVEGQVSRVVLEGMHEATGTPAVLFHAAGSSTVGAAETDPEASKRDTVATAEEALSFIARSSPETVFVYPSSCAVYGDVREQPIPETAVLQPVSRYGEYKALVEDACGAAEREAGTRSGIIRFFSLYGRGLEKQLLWDIATKARNGSQVSLGGTGEETRDFVRVEDAARLVTVVARHLIGRSTGLIVNGASGRVTTIAEVARALVGHLPGDFELLFSGERRPHDPAHYQADVEYSHSLGFAPEWSFEQGIADYAAWARTRLWG